MFSKGIIFQCVLLLFSHILNYFHNLHLCSIRFDAKMNFVDVLILECDQLNNIFTHCISSFRFHELILLFLNKSLNHTDLINDESLYQILLFMVCTLLILISTSSALVAKAVLPFCIQSISSSAYH